MMTLEATESDDKFIDIEERLADLFGGIETTIQEESVLLHYIDRVENHCKRAMASMEAQQLEVSNNGNENTNTGGTSLQAPESTASSTTDTTGSEQSIQASESPAALESQGSLSVLETRHLFPGKPSPTSSLGLTSLDSSSSPSWSRTQFVRTITHAKEQQVQEIMSSIKKRMKSRSSP